MAHLFSYRAGRLAPFFDFHHLGEAVRYPGCRCASLGLASQEIACLRSYYPPLQVLQNAKLRIFEHTLGATFLSLQ